MLGLMRVADQFRDLESRLPADWEDAQLVFTVDDARQSERAAALLAPLGPGRRGNQIRLVVSPREGRLDLLRRLLARLDRERLRGKLEVVTFSQTAPEVQEDARAAWQ